MPTIVQEQEGSLDFVHLNDDPPTFPDVYMEFPFFAVFPLSRRQQGMQLGLLPGLHEEKKKYQGKV